NDGLILIKEPLGSLRRRQRAACRILVLDLEPVAVDPSLVELLDCKLNALLVLHPKIGAGAGHGEKPADLDDLVLRVGAICGSEQGNACDGGDTENGRMFSHGALPRAIFI